MIEIHNLTKNFGMKPVLRGVNLTVERGEFVALMGTERRGQDDSTADRRFTHATHLGACSGE